MRIKTETPTNFNRLIAIMLGRLEMTIEDCIERFCVYADDIFTSSKRTQKLRHIFLATKYDADRITQATKRLVGTFDPTPEDEKWKRNVFATRHGRCKTYVSIHAFLIQFNSR